MYQRSWVSHYIIPCPGIDRCEYYEPGESNHPTQHTVSKVVHEDKIKSRTTSNKRPMCISVSGTFLNNLADIAYDPKLDPPNKKVCFNCWRSNHLLRDCYAKKRWSFCKNCGRRSVEIEDCPRCAKAYCEYIEKEDHLLAKIELYGDVTSDYYEKKKKTGFQVEKSENCYQAMSMENNSEPHNGSSFEKKSITSSDLSRKVCDLVLPDSKNVESDNYEDESKNQQVNRLINAVKASNLEDENRSSNSSKDLKKREEKLKESTAFSSQDHDHRITSNATFSSTKIHKIEADATEYKSCEEAENDEEFLNMNSISEMIMEDEDYNDMIIDEDEKSIKSNETGDTLQLFINLLGTVKNLPIEAQNFAVGCFVKSHKQNR